MKNLGFLSRSVATLFTLTVVAGCGHSASAPPDPLKDNPGFASISRDVSGGDVQQRSSALSQNSGSLLTSSKVDPSQSFYLAVNKSELGKKFFLSTYLTQYFPGAVSAGAAHSMGTRIVTLQEQNGKLFLIDASNGHDTSTTFSPELILEAYPVVFDSAFFNALPSASRYLLVDPAAGISHFSLLSEAFGSGSVKFDIELSFLQRFRTLADGITFEQVFTGRADQPINAPTATEPNLFRASGTLGVALRSYTETPGFKPFPAPSDAEHYFRGDPKLVTNTGAVAQTAIRWGLRKDLNRPVQWKISPSVNSFKSDPRFADIDVAGALVRAVENWNSVFGFTALQASVATAGESFGDDDVNYILFDEDPTYGAAFANWRTNPDTGEVRGASVYFSSLWLEVADVHWPANPGVTVPSAALTQAPRTVPTRLSSNLGDAPLCVLPIPAVTAPAFGLDLSTASLLQTRPAQAGGKTRKQLIEDFITAIALHEIGHTLGLRHNFEGSLTPPSSSVMDYTAEEVRPDIAVPQAYDVAAVQYLYDLAPNTFASYKFCTDEDEELNPNCAIFDQGKDPLHDYYGTPYTTALTTLLTGKAAALYLYQINGLMNFVAEPAALSATDPVEAFHLLFDPMHPPLAPALRPTGGSVASSFSWQFLKALLAPPSTLERSNYATKANYIGPAQPVTNAAALTLVVAEIRLNLLNPDGIRTFTNRRVMVDLLKGLQRPDAYQALLDARDQLDADIAAGKLTGDALNNTRDLLARVTAALTPYYK